MFQLTLTINAARAEIVTDRLEQAGASAVSLVDARDEPIYEPGVGETPLWARTRVSAWFEKRNSAHSALVAIEPLLGPAGSADVAIESVADQDWVVMGQAQSPPICFANKLWVVPPRQASDYTDVPHVLLSAGLAFGSGTHPTTALCLEWLCAQQLAGTTVIDYGCGSGILGIAALKLGAARVIAVDHDHQAISSTRNNAECNGVAMRLRAGLPDTAVGTRADIVIANILLNPLLELAPQFRIMLNPGGRVVLSGIMQGQIDALNAIYGALFTLEDTCFQQDWARVVCHSHY